MLKPATRQLPRPTLRVVGGACHDDGGEPQPRTAGRLTVALVGQPNVGKSTVFNMLTGLSQHVGNWPGKTVEQKTGTLQHDGVTLDLVDLPGTYSLTANSEEERIARDYLIREKPDLVIAVVNAAALERSLYLTAELLALDLPLVVGLNMSDVAEQHGIHVEPHVLSAALGLPVISLVASKNVGVHELVDEALKLAAAPEGFRPNRPTIRPEHRPVLAVLAARDRRSRSRALPGGLGGAETPGRRFRDHRPGRGLGAAGRVEAGARPAAPARGRVSRHRRRPLRVGRPDGARRGHAAQGRRGHPHRADRPGRHAPDLGAVPAAGDVRGRLLADLHDRHPDLQLAGDLGARHARCNRRGHAELGAALALRAGHGRVDPRRRRGLHLPADPGHLLRRAGCRWKTSAICRAAPTSWIASCT